MLGAERLGEASPSVVEAARPRLTIGMCGPNVVIRSSSDTDHATTATLTDAVNAASETGVVILIDPDRIRCDDALAAEVMAVRSIECREHVRCRTMPVEAVAAGVVRIRTGSCVWIVDVGTGRLCRTDGGVDVRFLPADAWLPIVAIFVLPDRVVALGDDGVRISAMRAHHTDGLCHRTGPRRTNR